MKNVFFAVLFLAITCASAMASTVVLQWDANKETDLTGYNVYQSTGATSVFAKVQTIPKGTQTATITGLDPLKGYSFAVTAYNVAGQESGYSNIVTVVPFPAVPTNLKSISIMITP